MSSPSSPNGKLLDPNGDINSSIADKPEIPSFFDLFGEFPEFGSF